jgi:hypothetical protein
MLARCGEKEPWHTVGENVSKYKNMENSMESPHKTKNRTTICSHNTKPRHIPEEM